MAAVNNTVPLLHPITSFAIPTVNAECALDETATEVSYRPPEVTDVIDFATGETFQTCRVPVVQSKRLSGYVPLPIRYQAVWLQLTYCIILYTNMRRLWEEEEQKNTRRASKENAAILRKNSGALVAQHMLARLLAVDELVSLSHDTSIPGNESVRILDEWKIRWSRDWFNTTYDKVFAAGAKFLNADPIPQENVELFESDWNVDEEGKWLLKPPADLGDWFDGEIKGLDAIFEKTLKKQALASLKTPSDYSQHHYNDKAVLPARWHEGHEPTPYFWSVKQWTWVAKGNSMWEKPIDLLYFCLTEHPPFVTVMQFAKVLNCLVRIVAPNPKPKQVRLLASQLWSGQRTWSEFVEALLRDHFRNASAYTSEKPDPNNGFNTLEARLVLEGYVRRHNKDEPWDLEDDVLWNALTRVTSMKYKSGWEWIVSQVASNSDVSQVLRAAGPYWQNANQSAEIEQQSTLTGNGTTGQEEELNEAMEEERVQNVQHPMRGDGPDGFHHHGRPPRPSSSHPQPPAVGPTFEEDLACVHFKEFLEHGSLERYEARMRTAYPSDHLPIIKDHVANIRAWSATNSGPPSKAFSGFRQRLMAAEARLESERVQEGLL
ncbi:hypothetical protein DEU56DRAFT_918170 [Suillus clintonianus]|uniref:uncharacterized protein n=1 Tax=Suillus clintonianus TaxID=1904413 RepID=UPI001B8604D2|nr:uncharacterized protein DEU56DRAFT_918170 [Suillus clintonianus]KAG2121484.1 hypothetical protein DEU56DRAFT_918170 [Suillus clintonianus]